MIIDASAANNYTDDTWIAVAVLVRDYNTEIITYGQQKLNPVDFSLQYTSFQVCYIYLPRKESGYLFAYI